MVLRKYVSKGSAPRFKPGEIPDDYTGRAQLPAGQKAFHLEKNHHDERVKKADFPGVAKKSLDATCHDCECRLGVEESVVVTDCMGELMQICFRCIGKRIDDARSHRD